jgi:hypothetical protein
MRRPNIKRRVALAGGTALIAAAGIGGFLALNGGPVSAHLTAAPTVQAPAADPSVETGATTPDTDNVQQQSGAQDVTGVDTAAANGTLKAASTTAVGAEPAGAEADGPGGHTDAAGAAGPDGNFNN